MTRVAGIGSKNLGRRVFGTTGRWKTPGEALERFGEVVDPREEIPRKPIALSVSRTWKPRAGRIYNFPVQRIVEEK